MKLNKTIIQSLLLLIVIGALYRVIPGRPYGFAPQIAMAVFAGMVIKDRKWVFAVPVLSMFISDMIYQILYIRGLTEIPGFYEWQWLNYLLIMGITAIGFAFKKVNTKNFLVCSFLAPTAFFLVSNFITWFSGFGYHRPLTFAGLMQCYADGLPFFQRSIVATLIFGVV
ncbi:MAG: DUF6580 family putative transport protein, partial [Chitinophagaceae bacterium]